MLISPLNAFPWVLNGLVEAWVSIKRVQAFLSLHELDLAHYYLLSCVENGGDGGGAMCEGDIHVASPLSIRGGSFTWRRHGESASSQGGGGGGEKEGEKRQGDGEVVEWNLSGVNLSIQKVVTHVLYYVHV